MSTDDKPVILDTNILFSALLSSQSSFAKTLLTSDRRFFVCEMVIVELFKHKDRITRLSQLAEEDVVRLFHVLLKRVMLYKEDMIAKANRASAYALCSDVDETDTPHVALTLELDGLLWTGDKKLKDGLKRKGFDRFFESNE